MSNNMPPSIEQQIIPRSLKQRQISHTLDVGFIKC